MANKKISELAVRTPSLSDLMLVGDPSTGYSYKATLSALSSLLEANIALDDLNDVTITSPTAGQVLSYNGTAWVNDTNGITGTGTTNYVPKFTSSSAIGNSQIFDNGTNVGIGTATPSDKFSVEGFISTNGTAGTGGIMLRQSGSEITRIYATPSRSILTSTKQINLSINYGLNLTIFPTGNVGVKISDDTDSGDAFQVLGTVKFRTIDNATTDTDRFIVSDGGVIKYRTGSEVLSDIGGAAASSISGTTNYIPKFTSSSAIGNSQIFDNGTSVGIGTTTPQTQLDIANGLMFGTIDAFPSATYDAAAVIAKTGSLGSAPFNNAGSIVYRARVTSTAGRSSHIFYTGSPSTERMRLNESGNLGLGVTPSAWSIGKAFEINSAGNAIWSYGTENLYLSSNAYFNGGWKYGGSGKASNYTQFQGQHFWEIAGTGTAGNAISFTTAMTLDASGRLGINETSITSMLQVKDVGGGNLFKFTSGTVILESYVSGGVPSLGTTSNTDFRFRTNDTERMRITSGGNVGIGTTNPTNKLDVSTPNKSSVLGSNSAINVDYTTSTIGEYQTIGFSYSSSIGNRNQRWGMGFTATNYTSGTGDLFFFTDATERARITSGGELLINTTTDAGDYKLQVNGNVYSVGRMDIYDNTNAGTLRLSRDAGSTRGYLHFGRFNIGSFQNVGTISVDSDANSPNNGNMIFFTSNSSGVNTQALKLTSTQNAEFAGSIKTAAPSGGTAKPFKIGAAATVTPTLQNRTIEIEIDGTTYYLTAKTTND